MAHVGQLFTIECEDAEFTAYCDPTPAGLPDMVRNGCAPKRGYGDIDAMLKAEKFDLLMIGSPNFMHLGHLRAALKSDTPRIFAEKPVVISEAETMEFLGLLRDHGGHQRVIVGLVLRYSPLFVALRKSLNAGQLGDVVSIEACEHIAPYHGSFFMRDWRRNSKLSGGFMLEKCCHDLDLYQAVAGARPMQIASFGGRKSYVPANVPARRPDYLNDMAPRWGGIDEAFASDGDIIDYQTAIVNYENGVNLCFHTNLNVPDEFRRFAVMGTKGMAEGDFIRNYYRVHDSRTGKALVKNDAVVPGGAGHYGADEAMARDLAEHFRSGTALPVTVLDALEAGLTALKMDEARLKGQVVELRQTWAEFDSYGQSARKVA